MNGIRMRDIRERHKDNGGHFFDRASMRFFDSRIERGGPYQGIGGIYFVTSEQFHGSQGSEPRKYTVRQVTGEDYDITTAGKFNEIRTVQQARDKARLLASGVKTAVEIEEFYSHA